MARLEVEIGADIKDLQGKLANAIRGLDNLKKEEKELTQAFKRGDITADKYYSNLAKYSTRLSSQSKNVSNYKNQISKLGSGIGSTGKATANAVPALNEFSRVIQDAPYGIQGVANNITQLTTNFGYLSKNAGGTKQALKLMLGTLTGPAGILLAISTITTLLVAFGDKLSFSKNRVKGLKDEQERLTKELEDYVFQLESVEKAQLKGSQTAVKELTTLKLLSEQVNNGTLSLNKRKGAIEQLRKKYPDYLKNMSDEKLLNGGLKTVYDQLTTSILKRAKATASMNAIIKNSEQILTIESQLAKKQDEIKKKEIKLANASTLAQLRAGKERDGINFSIEKQIEVQKELNKLKAEENKLIGQKQGLELSNIDLEQNVSGLGGIAKTLIPDGTSEKIKNKVDILFNRTYQEYKTGQKGFQDLILNNQVDFNDMFKDFNPSETFIPKLTAFQQEINNLIQGTLANTFSDIGSVIGNGLAQGLNVLSAVGGALISGIGNLIGAMGDKLIDLGTAAILAGTVTQLFGSIAGIGAGFAAIAGGVALKAVGSGVSGFAGAGAGTNAGTSTSSGGGFSGGFSGGYANNQKVEFVIRGENLWGVLDNYTRRNGNLGVNLTSI